MAMTQIIHAIFFLLVLMTCQENTSAEGRILSSINKGDHNKRRIEQKKIQDVNSSPLQQTSLPVKMNQDTDPGKSAVVQKGDAQHAALTTDSGVRHSSSGYKDTNGGKYNVENKQEGYSPRVYYPFVETEGGAKQKVQPKLEDTTHDYSPGVGHSVPATNEDTKRKAAGDTSIVADKRNAGGKPSDYSPGVGHFIVHDDKEIQPESQDNDPNNKHSIQDKTQGHSPGVGHSAASFAQTAATKVRQNSNTVRHEQFKVEQLTIESHSPGVGHSIQQKKAEPRAKK